MQNFPSFIKEGSFSDSASPEAFESDCSVCMADEMSEHEVHIFTGMCFSLLLCSSESS